MRKTLLRTSILIMAAVTLGGCASLPKLSDEQNEMVSEYAAALLLKYDSENHSRLVDTRPFLKTYYDALEVQNEERRLYEKKKAREEAKAKTEAANQDELNKKNAPEIDADVVDKSGDGTGGATVVDSMSLTDFVGENFTIEYAGFDLMQSYPEDGGDMFFSMDARQGKKLLVVYFNVTNLSSDASELDIMDKGLTFKFSINGEGFKSTEKTLLMDELSEFKGEIAGNGSERLVLISEVSEGTEIISIDMKVSDVNGGSITNKLK